MDLSLVRLPLSLPTSYTSKNKPKKLISVSLKEATSNQIFRQIFIAKYRGATTYVGIVVVVLGGSGIVCGDWSRGVLLRDALRTSWGLTGLLLLFFAGTCSLLHSCGSLLCWHLRFIVNFVGLGSRAFILIGGWTLIWAQFYLNYILCVQLAIRNLFISSERIATNQDK